ncbi:hypothetical protein JAAARDRAFT_33064 [Jaapia argillacea MUCL 33604]|uniref:F-box domain-containing protein n=1 Tax=Jaapia argillacea MUCL 33604 TaxID=933084 RepID=A0A067Q038_9AGAM|nr:hypothetical protein JAAARDRAFT_33064 [Jaapia argillacea MUCL 33604]
MAASSSAASKSYLCDTLPAPRLASAQDIHPSSSPNNSPPLTTTFDLPPIDDLKSNLDTIKSEIAEIQVDDSERDSTSGFASQSQPPARKLCVRHQRMADEGISLKMQKGLDALPVHDREAINTVWSTFSSSPHPRRALILQGLLSMCCFSQLSFLSEQLEHLIRLDPFSVLPREVALKVLTYLDATSLCRAAQVSKQWQGLADDDILWRGICEQHIGQKCHKCGWGLPILEKKRFMRIHSRSHPSSLSMNKRELEEDPLLPDRRAIKRQRSHPPPDLMDIQSPPSSAIGSRWPSPPPFTSPPLSQEHMVTRPWKDVYCERLTIERNWRRGRCTVRTLKGHSDGVMCLQFSETLSHPSFPILITGSYDRTARVWNLETGVEIRCLRGHTRAVRALQFDEAKLITGSMDHTIKVWDWRTGRCLRTLEGHTEGVVCLNYDENVLASGSVDSTIKVWNFRTKESFTLRGHRDWVNAVQLWNSAPPAPKSASPSCSSTNGFDSIFEDTSMSSAPSQCIDPGKMLFSASDDGTIRLWDLSLRTCVRLFNGHVGQVQSMKLLLVDPDCDDEQTPTPSSSANLPALSSPSPRDPRSFMSPGISGLPASSLPSSLLPFDHPGYSALTATPPPGFGQNGFSSMTPRDTRQASRLPKPVLISGSLDNTIKIWDIDTGKALKTMFGHIEGVWAVASDKLRLVSGSHDRTIKVWNRDEGRCMATLVGHKGAVTCLALGEDKIVSGSDDGDIRIWSFSG